MTSVEEIKQVLKEKKPLFGTSGIRGVTNLELTPQFALDLGHAYGTYLNRPCKVAVGRDTRYGAEMLEHALIAGLISTGVDVADCGCIPTPGLAHYIVSEMHTSGVMITGSHMPKERIGVLFLQHDGTCIASQSERAVEKIFYERAWEGSRKPPEAIGTITRPAAPLLNYRNRLTELCDVSVLAQMRYSVLVDPCNGTVAGFFAQLLEELGCRVIEINGTQSPEPNRAPEPRAKTLRDTARATLENDCDLGIAFDIDADRVLFIDAIGSVVSEDVIGALFARELFKSYEDVSGLACVTAVNSSGLIERLCAEHNANVEYCRIGPPDMSAALKRVNAMFAYEESGKYFFARRVSWPDGPLAALELLSIMSTQDKALHELVREFPVFHQRKHVITCSDELKPQVLTRAFQLWDERETGTVVKTIELDGVKRVYDDSSWLLFRPSGTEPLIRVNSDAMTVERAEHLVKFGVELVNTAMTEISN